MKWLIWILLVLNFALLGFFLASSYVADPPTEPAPAAPYSGSIKLLTPEMLAAMPKKAQPASPAEPAAPTPTPTPACYEWSGFTATEAARAPLALKKLGLQATPKKQAESGKKRYWVYIPPQKSMPQAETKIAELRILGITDSFIVQDPKWRYAISLGIFKDEALANDYLQKLHGMGIKSATKAKRDEGSNNTQISYIVSIGAGIEPPDLNALKTRFPGSELNPVDCR